MTSGDDITAANNSKIPTVSALIAYAAAQIAGKADTATTIAGYGITDAKIKNGTITLGTETITPIPVVTGETGEVPKFKADGTIESTGFTLGKTVPADAVFTDTTYSEATQNAAGLMSAADKVIVDGVTSALANKLDTSLKGVNGGLAELDSTGKVPSSQLPSYVDDVIEGYYYNSKFYEEAAHNTEITAESGKIYVDLTSNNTYRYSGTQFTVISETLALGETNTTAYRGDRGKTAYDHSQLTTGNPHQVTKSEVGLGNVTNDKQVKAVNTSTDGNTVVGDIVTFGGIDGATIADSGKKIKDSGTIGNSSTDIPTANVIASAISTATSDVTNKADRIASENRAASSGKVLVATSGGEFESSGKTVGGSTLNASPDANTLATEAAVNTAITNALSWGAI